MTVKSFDVRLGLLIGALQSSVVPVQAKQRVQWRVVSCETDVWDTTFEGVKLDEARAMRGETNQRAGNAYRLPSSPPTTTRFSPTTGGALNPFVHDPGHSGIGHRQRILPVARSSAESAPRWRI